MRDIKELLDCGIFGSIRLQDIYCRLILKKNLYYCRVIIKESLQYYRLILKKFYKI